MNLADPELELIDPTPNVHALFVHFDSLFFRAKLANRVVVRWSKRMYVCAGVCSFDARGGYCDIGLSEPLLKLRPRKDLVETLLHEMIHAFLFITLQDRDRDGHGPLFKGHMNRINRLAGVNITIYHDFKDEVELYKVHWWRCNGPCQTQKPYFGILRRSVNKAPGPSDYWWRGHMRGCGGTFIKIKEPEKKSKAVAKPKKIQNQPDITSFVKNVTNRNNIPQNQGALNASKNASLIAVKSKMTANNPSTVVVNKKTVIFNPTSAKPPVESNNNMSNHISAELVAEAVRKAWTNRQIPSTFPTTNSSSQNTAVRPMKNKAVSVHENSPPAKIKKINDNFKNVATTILQEVYGQDYKLTQADGDKLKAVKNAVDLVDCPICCDKINSSEINKHLDECLNKDLLEKLTQDEEMSDTEEPSSSQANDSVTLQDPIDSPAVTTIKTEKKDDLYNSNNEPTDVTDNIGANTFINSQHDEPDSTVKIEEKESEMSSIKIKVEPGTSKNVDSLIADQTCLCCGNKLETSVVEHLDDCLAFFDNNTTMPEEPSTSSANNSIIIIDDNTDEEALNNNVTKFPCPCCHQMVEQAEMNDHLDGCLNY